MNRVSHIPASSIDHPIVGKIRAGTGQVGCVCMLCPGGVEHAGGIGRWAGYMRQAWLSAGLHPEIEIVDTRGFGGWIVAGRTFCGSLLRLIVLRATGRLALIHANMSIRSSSARKCVVALLARVMGVKLIVQLHSGRFFDFYAELPYLGRLAVRRMFASSARIIVMGKVWEDQLVTVIGVPRSKIITLYNAVPLPDRLARSTVPDGDVCHIVMLGRMGPPKGVPELLEALSGPAMRSRSWRLTLAGDGDAAAVKAEAARCGIGDRIQCPGWIDVDAVSRLLREADILVLPSRSENQPMAVIEALAHRVAVITTPVGTIPELVTDGVSALLVPVKDPQALSGALINLIDDPNERARIAHGGHDVFKSQLDTANAAPILAAVYRDVLYGTP